MRDLLLGAILVCVGAFAFWSALPTGGKVQPWLTPGREPLVAVAVTGAVVMGVGLAIFGLATMLVS